MADAVVIGLGSMVGAGVFVVFAPAAAAAGSALLISLAVAAAVAGVTAESVDRVARDVIDSADYGHLFVHRTGHGIGIEEHEDPYLVVGNETVLVPGHAFSVEPGIYQPGRFGMRLEDIVVIGADGQPESLNNADHGLVVVDV